MLRWLTAGESHGPSLVAILEGLPAHVRVTTADIGDSLGFGPRSVQWVVSAYAIGLGGLLLFGGRAVDRLGPRRMFMVGLALYGVASLVTYARVTGEFVPSYSITPVSACSSDPGSPWKSK